MRKGRVPLIPAKGMESILSLLADGASVVSLHAIESYGLTYKQFYAAVDYTKRKRAK